MMQNIIKLLLLSQLLFNIGCQKVVNMDVPITNDKLVLIGMIGNETPLQIGITRTYGIFDYVDYTMPEEQYAVDIIMTVNNDELYELKKDTAVNTYTSDYIPKAQDKIEITAMMLDFDTIKSRARIPNKLEPYNIQYADSAFVDEIGKNVSLLILGFQDIPDVINYYEVNINAICTDSLNTHVAIYGLSSNSPIIQNENILNYDPYSLVFSDALFKDQKIELDITFKYYFQAYDITEHQINQLKIFLTFSNISKEYYLYKKTLLKQTFDNEQSIWENMGGSEPINVFTNIEGGYGIFAGYAPYIDTLKGRTEKKEQK